LIKLYYLVIILKETGFNLQQKNHKTMKQITFLQELFLNVKQIWKIPLIKREITEEQKSNLKYQRLKHKDILTLDEAAFFLDVAIEVVCREASQGNLPGAKLGGQWYFYKSALTRLFSTYSDDISTDYFNNIEDIDLLHNKTQTTKTLKNLLQSFTDGERNFSGICLSGALMSGLSLPDIDLAESYLSLVDFTEANLIRAVFQDANLREANLSGADLSFANLKGADLSGANLSQANFVGANLQGVILVGANLSGANLENSCFWPTIKPRMRAFGF